jgi:hypothetical protein
MGGGVWCGAARRERDRGFGHGAHGIGSSLSGMPFRGLVSPVFDRFHLFLVNWSVKFNFLKNLK